MISKPSMLLLCLVPLVCPIAVCAVESDVYEYQKRETWAETVAYNRSRAAGQVKPPAGVKLTPWMMSSAFASESLDQAIFSEDQPTIDLSDADGAGQLQWKKHSELADGRIQDLRLGGSQSVYLTRVIRADADTTLSVHVSYDDEIAVWVNGGRVLHSPGPHGMGNAPESLPLSLGQGENTVLMKLRNRGGRAAIFFGYGSNVADPMRVWKQIQADFPDQCQRFQSEFSKGKQFVAWLPETGNTRQEQLILGKMIDLLQPFDDHFRKRLAALVTASAPATDSHWLALYQEASEFQHYVGRYQSLDTAAFGRAVDDLQSEHPDLVDDWPGVRTRLEAFQRQRVEFAELLHRRDTSSLARLESTAGEFDDFKREILLRNPLLDFDRLMLVKRDFGPAANHVISAALGMPSLNSHTHDTIPHTGWSNEITVLSDLRGERKLDTLYRPEQSHILCEVDLDFPGDRIMFSSIGANDRWALFEVQADGQGLHQLTPEDLPDVDFFDSCYLPDGRIATTSTAPFQGLPCENGGKPMASLYQLDPRTRDIRRLTFEQDSDWAPCVLSNGRVMYLRWEYTDSPHYFTRVLMSCNPDGTGQMEYYGSNSYFPNSFFFARPIPDHPTKVVGVVGGHHGISRSGRLLILDPEQGRQEADGVVQEIPGWEKQVDPILVDRLIDGVWPQFLHPYPLSEKYFLVAAKPAPGALWGIYLVDVFDNMTLVKEVEGSALLEPVPLRSTLRPPVIADRVIPGEDEATVYLTDIYGGPGLKGVPRGTVKQLRLFSYHYSFVKTGGHASVGVESSWDVKRILGTVPVEADGSASFKIPANLPLSIQPLDEGGRALQLMRSWLVGMPGEVVSCAGCHEPQNSVTPNVMTLAAHRRPSTIEPWYGPPRPFGFYHEVQPVLDRYCIGCHDGGTRDDSHKLFNLTADYDEPDYKKAGAYQALQPYVRRPGPESDYHLTNPLEYHASTSELIQMLEKGHHGVRLDAEAWDRLQTWIDLNAPYRGRWAPAEWRECDQLERRLELAAMYEGVFSNPEAEYVAHASQRDKRAQLDFVQPESPPSVRAEAPKVHEWPFDDQMAQARQVVDGSECAQTLVMGHVQPEGEVDTSDPTRQSFTLSYRYSDDPIAASEPIELHLTRIPAGSFVMGSADGPADERPPSEASIDRPFWIGTYEISNRQFTLFDPAHDSRYVDMSGKDHSARGFPLNRPEQPVTRVSWIEAIQFCQWLSGRIGRNVSLPTESQWEWACRAGTDTPLTYGDVEDDFSSFANLADRASQGSKSNPFPRITSVNDSLRFSDARGVLQPNAWGLYDMHGNVAEWTRSAYRPYPYDAADGRNELEGDECRVARGGSWRDRPSRATSSFRLPYRPYQKVLNVGFRVVIEE